MKRIIITSFLVGILAVFSKGEDKPRIVLHAVKILKSESYRAFFLEDDYGYVVLNDGTSDKPKPRYILGSQVDRSVNHYASKKDFLAAVNKIPAGASLRQYSKCLVPLSLGLKDEQLVYKEVTMIAKKKGIKLHSESKVYCNCPSSLTKKK